MKNNIYAATLVALAIAIACSLVSCDKSTKQSADVFDAIPENSSLVVRTENIDSISSLIADGNKLMDMFYSPKSEIAAPICCVIDSLKKAGLFGNHLQENAALAIRKDGNSGLCQLYICVTDLTDDSAATLTDSLKHIEASESRIYNDREIVKYKIMPSGKTLSISFINGLMLASSSQRYIEDAILCLTGAGRRQSDDELFAKAFATSGKKELANVMISTKEFVNIFASELFEDNDIVKTISETNSWASFDLVSGKPLTLNGFDFPKGDSTGFTSIIGTQPAIEFSSLAVIPEKSAAYILMSFANPQRYDEALNAYLSSNGRLKDREKIVSAMNDAFGLDAKERFYSLIKQEFAYVVTESSYDAEKGVVVICGLQSQSAAEMELRKMVSDDNVTSLGEGFNGTVFKMPYDDIPAALFGEIFANCRGKYVCCMNNFMVFANSIDDLRMIAKEITLNNTMKANLAHKDFRNNFATSSAMFAYFSFAQGPEMLKRIFSRQYAADIENQKYNIGGMGAIGIQMKEVDEMMYCNISLVESDQPAMMTQKQTSWETNIGTDLATKPFVVTNHDTGEKEIIVQDKNNVLYLINSSGREIWHIQIDDRIIGNISQVDSYKNDKLQYLFSTKNKIYIVDRLGNFMPKFPLQLRSEATTPVSVFDYENKRNYRIMVACEDKHVYVYDVSGNLIKGWNFGEAENTINSEILHYVISTEDFIVFHDSYKAYFVARNGSPKMQFQTNFRFSDNNIYCDLSSSAKFVTTDDHGTIHRFFKSNKQDSISIRQFSPKHNFVLGDIDSDSKPEYIFTDSTKIFVYNSSNKLLFEHDFGATASKPYLYKFGRETKIGIIAGNGKIYLINQNGTMHNGFPLDGTTPFSIYEAGDTDGTYNLLTGLSRGRLCNYKITK